MIDPFGHRTVYDMLKLGLPTVCTVMALIGCGFSIPMKASNG